MKKVVTMYPMIAISMVIDVDTDEEAVNALTDFWRRAAPGAKALPTGAVLVEDKDNDADSPRTFEFDDEENGAACLKWCWP